MATRCLDDAEWRRLSVADYLRLKLTVTVMRTSIGAQLSSVGANSPLTHGIYGRRAQIGVRRPHDIDRGNPSVQSDTGLEDDIP